MKNQYFKIICIVSIGIFLFSSCGRTVTRISSDTVVDYSGNWNNTDSRLVSEKMIQTMMNAPWVQVFTQVKHKKPTIIVGFVVNKTHNHIDAETFLQDLETAIVNSGTIRLVQGGEQRKALRAERADQQDNASLSTMKRFGLEHGADFMLQGVMTSTVDAFKKNKVVQYQVSLQLSNLETNEIVWMSTEKITKTVKN
ncbi:MAG: penicillin-binding protein activator LpoB [Chitinophagaceae bacterium]